MKKRVAGIVSVTLALCLVALPACTQSQDTVQEEEKTFSEGADTACEVTGYTDFNAAHPGYFLQKGDRVAVISPSALPSREQVDATVAGLKEWGYTPVEGEHVCEEERTLEECKADLTWALEDSSIKAIYCVRGGYGANEVMDALSVDDIRAADKPIIGYSDITVYHSAWTVAGLPSVHSSMSATFMDLPEDCAEVQSRLMQGEVPSYSCTTNEHCKPGAAEGVLIGGNLSTLTAVLNTAYDCTKTEEPYILFVEDVGEDMQHIHRYLTILRNRGVLKGAAGIVFGEWADTPQDFEDYDGSGRGGTFASVADMIDREFLQDIEVPVAFGFPAGHADRNYPLLMGETARLDVSEDTFALEWLSE